MQVADEIPGHVGRFLHLQKGKIGYRLLKCTKQEVWILFQNMSKAFDKINLNYLIDACKWISIPQNVFNFIYNFYSNRKARIITA